MKVLGLVLCVLIFGCQKKKNSKFDASPYTPPSQGQVSPQGDKVEETTSTEQETRYDMPLDQFDFSIEASDFINPQPTTIVLVGSELVVEKLAKLLYKRKLGGKEDFQFPKRSDILVSSLFSNQFDLVIKAKGDIKIQSFEVFDEEDQTEYFYRSAGDGGEKEIRLSIHRGQLLLNQKGQHRFNVKKVIVVKNKQVYELDFSSTKNELITYLQNEMWDVALKTDQDIYNYLNITQDSQIIEHGQTISGLLWTQTKEGFYFEVNKAQLRSVYQRRFLVLESLEFDRLSKSCGQGCTQKLIGYEAHMYHHDQGQNMFYTPHCNLESRRINPSEVFPQFRKNYFRRHDYSPIKQSQWYSGLYSSHHFTVENAQFYEVGFDQVRTGSRVEGVLKGGEECNMDQSSVQRISRTMKGNFVFERQRAPVWP